MSTADAGAVCSTCNDLVSTHWFADGRWWPHAPTVVTVEVVAAPAPDDLVGDLEKVAHYFQLYADEQARLIPTPGTVDLLKRAASRLRRLDEVEAALRFALQHGPLEDYNVNGEFETKARKALGMVPT